MKKLNFLLMMLTSLTLLFATSCGKNDEPIVDPPIEISLGVSGGTDVVIDGTDIQKDVTVAASAAAIEDIIVSLSSDAAAGEATFAAQTVTIKKGEKTAVGKITFAAAKFPKDTPQKKITVTINTTTDNVKIDVPTTEFKVSGKGGIELPTLTIKANGSEFDTTDGEKTVSLTFTLSAALEEELSVNLTLGSETSDNIKAMFPATIPPVKIAASEKTFTLDYPMPKGTEGKLVVNFAIDNKDVSLETTTLSATFKVNKPVSGPLCAITELDNTWWQLAGFTVGDKTITIADDAPAYEDMLGKTIANVKEGDPIKVGVKSKDGDQSIYCHVWVDWNKDNNVTADEMVGSTETKKHVIEGTPNNEFLTFNFAAPAETPAGEYHMRIGTNYESGKSGCDNPSADESRTAYDLTINYTPGDTPGPGDDPTFSVETAQTDVVVPTTGNIEVEFQVKLSAPAEEAQTIALIATSTDKNGTVDPTSVTIPAGETSASAKIKFLSSDFTSDAVSATVTVTASSETLQATTGKDKIVFKVKGTASTTPIDDIKLYIYRPNPIFFTNDNPIDVQFNLTANNGKVTKDIVLTPVITGGVEGTDYTLDSKSVTIKEGTSSVPFKITVLKAGAGKDIKVDFSNCPITFVYPAETFALVTSSIYEAPASPEDYQVEATFATPITTGKWNSYSFKVTNGKQSGPIFIAITAKDQDNNDIPFDDNLKMDQMSSLNGKPVRSLINGSGSGYLQAGATLKGKTITLTFTSDDTTFKTTTATIVVEP